MSDPKLDSHVRLLMEHAEERANEGEEKQKQQDGIKEVAEEVFSY